MWRRRVASLRQLIRRFRFSTPLGWPSARSRPKSIQATSRPRALAGIDRLIEGWRVSGDNPGRLAAARVLETFESLGAGYSRHAAAALLFAEADLDDVAGLIFDPRLLDGVGSWLDHARVRGFDHELTERR